MERYDVVIAGGGVAGLSCALTLSSSKGKGQWAEGRRFLVIDSGKSDLLKAMLNNVPGIPAGTTGKKALEDLAAQALAFGNVEIVKGSVKKVEGARPAFIVHTEDGSAYESEIVVLATGFHSFDADVAGVRVVPHANSPKEGRVMIVVNPDSTVRDGLYVAGILAGVSTMYATAAGSGTQVACTILSGWAGKKTVVHDRV